jgi:hypothetical protein
VPTAVPCEGSMFVSSCDMSTECPMIGVFGGRGPRNDGPAAEFAKVCHFFVHAFLPTGGFVHAFEGVRLSR